MPKPINIAEAMHALIEILTNEGVNGMTFPDLSPEGKDEWSPDYAIAQNAYYDDFMLDDGARHYFDSSELIFDLKKLVKEHFASDPTVIVGFFGEDCMGISEIEAYRKGATA